MFGQLPWFMNQTVTVTVFCPWSKQDVTLRYLTQAGLPTMLIGCDRKGCAMRCVGGADAHAPSMATETPTR